MKVLKYSEYINLVPNRTAKFVYLLLSYLGSSGIIQKKDFEITSPFDLLLYKSLKAYQNSDITQKSVLQKADYEDNDNLNGIKDLSDYNLENLFSKYYSIFTPFTNEEDYQAITPEDILLVVIKRAGFGDCPTAIMDYCRDNIIKAVENNSKESKAETILSLNKTYNEDYRISVINYLDMVGKVFVYLRTKKDSLLIIDKYDEFLRALSFIIAIFYYNNVSLVIDQFNEQQVMANYLNSKGLTIEKINKVLGISINKEELEKIDSTLVLWKYFSDLKITGLSKKGDFTVRDIFGSLDGGTICNQVIARKALGLFDLTLQDATNAKEKAQKAKEESKQYSMDDFYDGLMPDVIAFLKQIAKTYTYLLGKRETLDKSLASTDYDLLCLAVLLSSYEPKNSLGDFYEDEGISLDVLLNLVKLPAKEEYQKELAKVIPNENLLGRFSNLFFYHYGTAKEKEKVTIDELTYEVEEDNRTLSRTFHKIYKAVTKKELPSQFSQQVYNHAEAKKKKMNNAKEEELLKDLPISVYSYLLIVSNYYQILSVISGLDQKDLEQLAIIFAAFHFDYNINKYFEKSNISKNKIAHYFLSDDTFIDRNYREMPFDIDLIDSKLRPYIFDRPNPEITVYSIFGNVFKDESSNSLKLKKVLFDLGSKPEDFFGIEEKLNAFSLAKEKETQNLNIEKIFAKCDLTAKRIMKDAILIHEYLTNSQKNSQLFNGVNDIEKMSILIALFINDDEYVPFFIRNGITIDALLSMAGMSKKTLEEIRFRPVNESLIEQYAKYLKQSKISKNEIVLNLFDASINDSRLLERLAVSFGSNYTYLKEEVCNKRERRLTLEEGVKLLESIETLDITTASTSSIIDFGTALSKHSDIINNEYKKLITSTAIKSSLNEINTKLENIYLEETVELPRKQSFFGALFSGPAPKIKVKKYDVDSLSLLQGDLLSESNKLNKEFQKYTPLQSYLESFLLKSYAYLVLLRQYISTLSTEKLADNPTDMADYIKKTNQKSDMQMLKSLIGSYQMTIDLMKKELDYINAAKVNHLRTIKAFEMAGNIIIPLMISKITANTNQESNNESLVDYLAELLVNITNNNIGEVKSTLEILSTLPSIDQEYLHLCQELHAYLEDILGSGQENILGNEPVVLGEGENFTDSITLTF